MWLTSEAAAGVAAASFCKTFFSSSKRVAGFLWKINDLPVFSSRIFVHAVLQFEREKHKTALKDEKKRKSAQFDLHLCCCGSAHQQACEKAPNLLVPIRRERRCSLWGVAAFQCVSVRFLPPMDRSISVPAATTLLLTCSAGMCECVSFSPLHTQSG